MLGVGAVRQDTKRRSASLLHTHRSYPPSNRTRIRILLRTHPTSVPCRAPPSHHPPPARPHSSSSLEPETVSFYLRGSRVVPTRTNNLARRVFLRSREAV